MIGLDRFRYRDLSFFNPEISMPYKTAGGKGPDEKYSDRAETKNAAFRTAARIVLWLLFIFIVVSAAVELMKGMGY